MGESLVQLQRLAGAARDYCRLVERLDREAVDWLERLSCLLPQIHAAVVSLKRSAGRAPLQSPPPDYDRRFELYSRLRRKLGEHDHYCLAFDRGVGVAEMSGSLADDITDIYFELKRGLDLLDLDPGHPARAASAWCGGFLWHWGQHLVDAERHLYELQVSSQVCHGSGRAD